MTSCLHCTTRWEWRGDGSAGWPSRVPTAAQGARLVPVGEEAIMPEAHAAAGQPMPQETSDTCVRVACHGLDTIALTTVAGGKAAPPVTHVEHPVVRHGDARRRAADRVQDVCRAGQGRLGVDDPLCGRELRAQLLERCRGAQALGAPQRGARRRWSLPGPAPHSPSRARPCSRPAPGRGRGDRPRSSAPRQRSARQPR